MIDSTLPSPLTAFLRSGRLCLLVAALVLAGCDNLLDVEQPDQVQADELVQPRNAETLVSGVIADYECSHAAYTYWAATLGDEFLSSGSADGVEQRADIRREDSNWSTGDCGEGILGLYDPISTARWAADETLRNLQSWTDEDVANRTGLIATTAAYAGFAHLFHAEGMQRAAFDGGPALTPADVLDRAEERFTRAIDAAQAAGDDEILNFALVGRARTRLNMAREAGDLVDPAALEAAAEDARRVEEGFSKSASYSTVSPRTENHIAGTNGPAALREVETIGAPYRNAQFDGVEDPRLPVVDAGRDTEEGFGIPLWQQQKYTSLSDPIEIASWEEAQLIIAEAELEVGNLPAAVGIINELHQRVGLPDTFDSDDPEEVFDQLMYERRAELFLEGQLLGDARRYDLPFSPAPGTETPRGDTYGEVRAFPLPEVETRNNPNID